MGNCAQLLAIGRLDPCREDHEGQGSHSRRELEVGVEFLLEYRWGEGLKLVAFFDDAVDAGTCSRKSRVGKNASVAESARAELQPALRPPDDSALCQQCRDFVEGLRHP